MNDELATEARSARRFGWTSLTCWALLGLGLEAAQGWKLSRYLDDELARSLLRLAHAHGVLLACVSLLYASQVAVLFATVPAAARSTGRALRVAGVLMPLGFGLGAFGHSETDPGIAVWLVPIGALCLLSALLRCALASWRER